MEGVTVSNRLGVVEGRSFWGSTGFGGRYSIQMSYAP